jgi:hypothetical protein
MVMDILTERLTVRELIRSRVYLPFEGDHVLSGILSKALLLAADAKITDPTIVSQLKR